jgi:hypothetical protein
MDLADVILSAAKNPVRPGQTTRRRGLRGRFRAGLVLLAVLGVVGCTDIETADPGNVPFATGQPAGAAGPNSPPVAVAGYDVSVFAGYRVDLDGRASADIEGDVLSYRWGVHSKPKGSELLFWSDAASPSFKPDIPGVYVLSLEVNDGRDTSLADQVTVTARAWFEDVTETARVPGGGPQRFVDGFGPGAAWGDYDGDGDPDLYITADGLGLLHRNEGDGLFTEVAAASGVEADCNSYGAAWGDYDNDGRLDLYIVCHSEDQGADLNHRADQPNILYRNNGDGTFTDVAREAGVDSAAHGTGASWVDYDMDGNLDLYVANFGIYGVFNGQADGNVLYRNNGDGTFANVTERAGVRGKTGRIDYPRTTYATASTGMTYAALWIDYDNDGDPDLLECDDEGVSPLYRNNADGTFTDVTEAAGLFRNSNCMGVDAGDYDRDGFLDIYWANYRENFLWRNNGDGTFAEVAVQAGVADTQVGWASGFADFDNDGLLDIFVVNGAFAMDENERGWTAPNDEPNAMYRNNGDGTFNDITEMANFSDVGVGRGAALADHDNDGDLDLYVVNAVTPNILFRNEIGDANNWLKLRFEGAASNRGGFGVRVRVETAQWTQTAEVRSGSGSGYLGGNEPGLHIGLGQNTEAARITLTWPSGTVQHLTDVPAGQTLTIIEPKAGD